MSQTIISLANALYAPSGPQQSQHEIDDRLDAARALLGVSPSSVAENNGPISLFARRESTAKFTPASNIPRRPRSDSVGLDALAFCAINEHATIESSSPTQAEQGDDLERSKPLVPSAVLSSDDDSESMPPPPPRTATRRRSVSNPEGMERWTPKPRSRLHFVLPASILEEELAEANAALKAKEESLGAAASGGDTVSEQKDQDDSKSEEEFLDQDELLRRARSRLLEDLSQGNINGEKGMLTLPHSLDKYKEVYNKNGRIGIYTPAERAAIISRFQSKRSRRVWNKKIRYNCRKNLADRRMRVKGRFVKRSTEEQAKAASVSSDNDVIPEGEEATFAATDSSAAYDSPATADQDEDMPDVTDPDAGFCPTEDQPYRRLRRHTIT